MKIGDRVLVEGILSSVDDVGDWVIESRTKADEKIRIGWAGPQMIRPWTEKPHEPVREVWRGKDKDGYDLKVVSNGSCYFKIASSNEWRFCVGIDVATVLAEYVRQTAGRP